MTDSDAPPTGRPRYKYSIGCCARWEHEDVLEWVSYHKSIGFDHIYLISNDDDPMPTFKVLTPFLFGPDPFVTFKHFPKPHPNAAQQPDIYRYLLENFRAETEWFSLIDVDEFFVLKGVDNIHAFMREYEDKCDALYFNWVLYGHSGKTERDHESLLLSHTQREKGINVHTKMLTRSSKIDPGAILKAYRAGGKGGFWHFWSQYDIPDFRQINVLGENMDKYGIDFPKWALEYIRQHPDMKEAILNKAYVAHFQFRSEADVRRRVERGGSPTNQYWKSKVDDGTFTRFFIGRNDVWDTYLANYWLRHVGAAYDIVTTSAGSVKGPNLALRKPNIQSSWHPPAPEDPKGSFSQGHGNNGIRTGTYGFRTMEEDKPWWMVDLLEVADIGQLHLYNDVSSAEAQHKAEYLTIEISHNSHIWTEVFQMTPEIYDGWTKAQPLVVKLQPARRGRYVRLSSAKPASLQLDEVEVYGP